MHLSSAIKRLSQVARAGASGRGPIGPEGISATDMRRHLRTKFGLHPPSGVNGAIRASHFPHFIPLLLPRCRVWQRSKDYRSGPSDVGASKMASDLLPSSSINANPTASPTLAL